MSAISIKEECKQLGFDLVMNVVDSLGRHWRYSTSYRDGGPVEFFNSASELRKYLEDVREVRQYADEDPQGYDD